MSKTETEKYTSLGAIREILVTFTYLSLPY